MTIGLKIKPSSTALLFKCFKIQSEHSVYIFALLKLVHQIGINVDIELRKTCLMPLLGHYTVLLSADTGAFDKLLSILQLPSGTCKL